MKIKIISQKMLSSECWLVQVWGFEVCTDCRYQDTEQCGGRNILITGQNILGHKIPLPDVCYKTRRNHES